MPWFMLMYYTEWMTKDHKKRWKFKPTSQTGFIFKGSYMNYEDWFYPALVLGKIRALQSTFQILICKHWSLLQIWNLGLLKWKNFLRESEVSWNYREDPLDDIPFTFPFFFLIVYLDNRLLMCLYWWEVIPIM